MRWRCWLGHKWTNREVATQEWEPFECWRCNKKSKQCSNCNRFHSPVMITVCIVTR